MQDAGNAPCKRNLTKPTLRLSFSSGAFQTDVGDAAREGYNTMMLSAAFMIKNAWESKSGAIDVPLEEREEFDIEFYGFTENVSLAKSADHSGHDLISPTDISVGLQALTGSGAGSTFQIRQAAPGTRMHAIFGLETGHETALALAAYMVDTPVIGWNYVWDTLVDRNQHRGYLRVPRVASSPGILISKLLAAHNYTKIYVFSQLGNPKVARQIRDNMGSDVEVIEERPPSRSRGPCVGRPQCMSDLIDAWQRLRDRDARVIIHEHGGETAEFLPLLLATDLLGPKTFYLQTGYNCFNIELGNAMAWGQADYRVMDSLSNHTSCKTCPNLAVYFLSYEEQKNLTRVAEFLYDAEANPYFTYQVAWCPQFPSAESLLNCSYCDGTKSYFDSPACEDLSAKAEAAMSRSFCVESDLGIDLERKALLESYIVCADLPSYVCKANYTAAGLYVTKKLLSGGMPLSYLEDYMPGGRMFEKQLASGEASHATYSHRWSDTVLADRLGLKVWVNIIKSYWVDAILTAIVGYNDFLRAGGDADEDSDPTLPPVRQATGNGVFNGWLKYLMGVGFESWGGRVEYLPSGERAVQYKLFQTVGASKTGCKVGVSNVTQPLQGDVLAAEWNFKNTPNTAISGELVADTRRNSEGCYPFPDGSMTGKIALVKRGACFFGIKALRAQAAGALAVLVINMASDEQFIMTADDSSIKVPGFAIGLTKGMEIWEAIRLNQTPTVTLPNARCVDAQNSNTVGKMMYGQLLSFDTKNGTLQLPTDGITFVGETRTPPAQEPALCGEGEEYFLPMRQCIACKPGRFRRVDMTSQFCEGCAAGDYANSSGNSACQRCPKGTYSSFGSPTCSACQPGSASADVGSNACVKCLKGWFQSESGQSQCIRCDFGTFSGQQGAANCSSCATGLTTNFRAATLSQDCTCKENQYFAGEIKGCLSCEEGMRCPGGLGPPLSDKGFFLETDASIRPAGTDETKYLAFYCADKVVCPGDLVPNTCPEWRIGRACGSCQAGRYAADDGECIGCGSANLIGRVAATIAGGIVAVIAFVFLSIKEAKVGARQSKITLTCMVTITLTTLQALGALSAIQIPWMEPLIFLQHFLSVFKIKIDVIEPSCIFQMESAVAHYVGSLLVLPQLLIAMFLSFRLIKLCRIKISRDNEISAYGKVVQVLFLGISLLSTSPFQCISNPAGIPTVSSYRAVRCWQGDETHIGFLMASVLACLLVLVPFIALNVRATMLYSEYVVRPGGVEWLKRYAFIFVRFRPNRYYYGLVHLLRSFFIALVPVVLSTNVQAQLLVMCAVLTTTLFLQAALWPWRGRAANYLDGAFSCGLLMLLTGGSMLAPMNKGHAEDTLKGFAIVIVGLAFALGLAAMSVIGYTVFFPPKRYAIFLSHHKGGAAVQARWMKEILKDKVSGKIFLDSDELDSLDLIFSVVAEQSKTFVLLLSAETLSRMWCAGEIVSAHRYHIPIVLVTTASYVDPKDEWIEQVGTLWTPQQLSDLSKFGIEVPDIQAAYRYLRTLGKIPFDVYADSGQQAQFIQTLLTACKGIKSIAHVATAFPGTIGRVASADDDGAEPEMLIAGGANNEEAVCTMKVIRHLLLQHIRRSIKIVFTMDEAAKYQANAKYLVVVLTRGLLERADFAAILHAASGLDVVPVLAETSFQYPDSAFYDALIAGKIFPLDAPIVQKIGISEIALLYKKLFTILALTFTAHGSSLIQQAEIISLTARFRWEQDDKAVSSKKSNETEGASPAPKQEAKVQELVVIEAAETEEELHQVYF
eukprot:TRINITY_DN12760_c0_g1_i3.p1 TRINITY_DN12760_c0_g1~~TRINITY_DN12760_c0_g1_i3.p1  ORF type:complete len:1977 (-),score=290.77 TRINITY_DN12760_c0_g1_i3:289-5610(-)